MNNSIILSPNRIAKAGSIYEMLKKAMPKTRDDLRNYLKVFLDINIGSAKICPEHDSPMDYLWHCFSSDFDGSKNGDCVVWAGRGGGKTYLAAIATLLDSIFKPGCKTRILAGSQAQGQRMYHYLLEFLRDDFEDFLAAPAGKNKCCFANGSEVEVLAQSAASVRGSHIHKLRCDEVELFNRHIFESAKFITKSADGIISAMETLSTMHHPFGIMHEIVGKAQDCGTKIFKWCLWEVIENCPTDRSCSRCPLDTYCGGKARKAAGYLKIDDCVAQMKRSSRAAFESEMLCARPSLENIVFAEFEPKIHIAPVEYNQSLPLYRAVDFGFVNPFVCLWIQVDDNGTVRVIDEYIKSRMTIDFHADEIKNKMPYSENKVIVTFCDPAGVGVNDVTGTSPVSQLKQAGMKLRYRKSLILEGVELIRRALRSGDGSSNLIISPRCGRLIEAMQCYHYPPTGSIEMP